MLIESRDCKILKSGLWHFTMHGMIDDTDFNAVELVGTALRKTRNLDEATESSRHALQERLRIALEQKRIRSRDAFRKDALDTAPLGVIIAGVIGGIPQMCHIRFTVASRIEESVKLCVEINRCPGPACPPPGVARIVVPGEDRELFQDDIDPVEATRRFLNFEIDKGPDYAAPISIVVIDRSGAHWLEKGVCPKGAAKQGTKK